MPTLTHSADVSIYVDYDQSLNPYAKGLPKEIDQLWNQRMGEVMGICLRHSDVISRINFWGGPTGIRGRTTGPSVDEPIIPWLSTLITK